MSYLIDTNVLFELLKLQPHTNVVGWFNVVSSESLYLSVLTMGEIRKGIEKLDHSHKKSKLVMWLETELPTWFGDRILAIDQDVAERWGYITAKNTGNISAIDSLIAATALVHNLKVVTRNMKDFLIFPDLEVMNPWD
jgi:predicted nucleic acid-binding protein